MNKKWKLYNKLKTSEIYQYKNNGEIINRINIGQEVNQDDIDYYSVDKQSILKLINELKW